MRYSTFTDIVRKKAPNQEIICIQGLGYVGAAMSVAIADAKDDQKNPLFHVLGVDLKTSQGLERINAINEGRFPFQCKDKHLQKAITSSFKIGNLQATDDPSIFSLAKVIIVSVPLHISEDNRSLNIQLNDFLEAIRTVGHYMQPSCLVIIETTVPPGTSEKIVIPELKKKFEERGLSSDSLLLAYSYERVMPGSSYLDSIVNFWRVYAGYTPEAEEVCQKFFSQFINIQKYPLTHLSSLTSAECAKILENSYRSVNIAFIEEWSRFAEALHIDLFEVIDAIRQRPTHSNIRQPGFGVGGYCLTKDPLFAKYSARELYKCSDLEFPFSKKSIEVNKRMPLSSVNRVEKILGGNLTNKAILLMGISYKADVSDTRYSPAQLFFEEAKARGASVACHAPLVNIGQKRI